MEHQHTQNPLNDIWQEALISLQDHTNSKEGEINLFTILDYSKGRIDDILDLLEDYKTLNPDKFKAKWNNYYIDRIKRHTDIITFYLNTPEDSTPKPELPNYKSRGKNGK